MELEEYKASLGDADPCSHCGACLSFCQWDAFERQNPGQRGDPAICRSCMVCFRICPRPQPRYSKGEEALFGAGRSSDLLGYYREALASKAVDRPAGAQDGGVTTALLKFMLREHIVEAALLTRRDSLWHPQPFVATTEAEVEEAAGSKYTTVPALAILGPALERFQRLAFVGVPCQIAALRNLQSRREAAYPADKVVLTIGLFCAESFVYGQVDSHGMAHFVEGELGISMERVTRFDIKKNNLLVFQGDKVESRPLTEIKHLAWPVCHSCPDFTAELADLSIGAVGS
ncbi:MAG: Coenzyme F420 hydrogenase/dehydrogenase, beta subunit C-terminal domain, partial [Dehalococcoidia bacterium]|nr:Coenzyme F420 hydrogenase/dehydrogenase, beta subunit C-terminal domain [Dehalococcoidia bacterium]